MGEAVLVFERQQNPTQSSNQLADSARLDRANSHSASTENPLITPQQSLGNQAVQRMLHAGVLQAKCACGGTPGPDGECAECRAKRLTQRRWNSESVQRKAFDSAGMSMSLSLPTSGGVSLGEEVRSALEQRFAADFSEVRIHADALAGKSALELGARAFTRGRDIYFAPGRYQPTTPSGLGLLAHELTHVVQQQNSRFPSPGATNRAAQTRVQLEDEAERAQRAVQFSSLPLEIRGITQSNEVYRSPDLVDELRKRAFSRIEALADWLIQNTDAPSDPVNTRLDQLRTRLTGVDSLMLPTEVVATMESIYNSLRASAPGWVPVPNINFVGPPTQQVGPLAIPVVAVLAFIVFAIVVLTIRNLTDPEGARALREAVRQVVEQIEQFVQGIPLVGPYPQQERGPEQTTEPSRERESSPRIGPRRPPIPIDLEDKERRWCFIRDPRATPIRWPSPQWLHEEGIGDPGSVDDTYDTPPQKILVKAGSTFYNPNRPEIERYRGIIKRPPFNLSVPRGWPIHHKWPQYLGGDNAQPHEGRYDPDGRILSPPNLVILSPRAHDIWHRYLAGQPEGPFPGQGPSNRTPDGTRFCVISRRW
jgi:Domain of unknown function (DUF4157)